MTTLTIIIIVCAMAAGWVMRGMLAVFDIEKERVQYLREIERLKTRIAEMGRKL